MTRVLVMHLGLDASSGISSLSNTRWIYTPVRNLTTVMAEASPEFIDVVIQSEATNIMSFGFTLPNGDKLFALWTNGKAVDVDLGVKSTLSFPGLATNSVLAIGILHGYEQELNSEMENGNLVIRNRLVKDYPIIMRISD